MVENTTGTKEKELYEYHQFPKNIRQIGVPIPGTKVYLEDYVVTYLKQNFIETDALKLAILLGKKGQDEASECVFIYGAIALEEQELLSKGEISREIWDGIHEKIQRCFSGAQIMGWTCSVGMWTAEIDAQVKKIQKKEFAWEDSVLYLWDFSEKEEKIFLWQRGLMKELSGYYVYYEKNPQMQEYMLNKTPKPSIDENYEDQVTESIRHVIQEKEERKKDRQVLVYCATAAIGIGLLLSVRVIMDGTKKIQQMEKTVDVLSEYVGQQQKEVDEMERQSRNLVTQIPYEKKKVDKAAGEKKKSKHKDLLASSKKEVELQEDTIEQSVEAQKNGKNASLSEDAKENSERESQEALDSMHYKKDVNTEDENVSTSENNSNQTNTTNVNKTSAATGKTGTQSYIVQKGDTLSQIIWNQYHDFSLERKVRQVNQISDKDKIYEGQCILLPDYK